jgi:NADH:ubiquinone oxidoreductase subunit 3 (subunit A)
MLYTYVALSVFAILAVLVPAGMEIVSRLMRPRPSYGSARNQNYESAEDAGGHTRDITNDYLHYFPLFIAFEIVSVMAILWAFSASALDAAQNVYMVALLLFFTILTFVTALLTNSTTGHYIKY